MTALHFISGLSTTEPAVSPPRTGKSLLVDLINVLATGRPMPVISQLPAI